MTIRFTPSRRPGQGRLATAGGSPHPAAVLGEALPAGPVAARPVAFTLAPAATGSALAAFAPLLASGQSLYCVDGANSFSPYRLAEAARRAGCEPALLLERVFVSRAYTCHQLEAAVAMLLGGLSDRPVPPLAAVLGVDRLFLDEDISLGERTHLFGRVLAHMERLAGAGLPLIVTLAGDPASPWARRLATSARLLPDAGAGLIALRHGAALPPASERRKPWDAPCPPSTCT